MKRQRVIWMIACVPGRGAEYLLHHTASYWRKGAWEIWKTDNMELAKPDWVKRFRRRCRAVKVSLSWDARR